MVDSNSLTAECRGWATQLFPHVEDRGAVVRLWLLESDLQSLRIALADFEAANRDVHLAAATISCMAPAAAIATFDACKPRRFHHAKVFVVAMRRFARLLEAAKSRKADYPADVGDAIALAWRKHHSFFSDYRVARDAIEHIDGEVRGTNRRFLNLNGDTIEVVDGAEVRVRRAALEVAEAAWGEILAAIMRPTYARQVMRLRSRLLGTLRAKLMPSEAESHNLAVELKLAPDGASPRR